MRFHNWALAALLAFVVQSDGAGDEKPPAPALPVVGKAAPAFRLNDQLGRVVDIPAGEEGRWTVLAFFPKAATPG